LNRRRLLEAIGIMGNVQAANDSEIELRLADGGYTPLEVKRLMAFVPLAFGRPILEQLGVSHFVESVSAKDRNGKWIQVPLASQDVYQAALTLAREHLRVGVMDHELFKVLALRCSQLDAASKALNAGANIKGATVAAALLGISAEDLAPETWIHRLKRLIAG